MSEQKGPVGQIRTETHGRIFKIIIDNASKKNSFSPLMMAQMSDALTVLHNNDALWVGVVCAEGSDFTAGLDMPKFFGPKAEKWDLKEGNIDVFGLANRCRKPIVTAVQGVVFTIGIEMMLLTNDMDAFRFEQFQHAVQTYLWALPAMSSEMCHFLPSADAERAHT